MASGAAASSADAGFVRSVSEEPVDVVLQPVPTPRGQGPGTAAEQGRAAWRAAAAGAGALALVLGCALVAAFAATAEPAEETASTSLPGGDELALAVEARRLSQLALGCRTAQEGEPCHRHVTWAMKAGIATDADRAMFPGLTNDSTFEEFQAALHLDPYAHCPRPCGATFAAQAAPSWGANGSLMGAMDLIGWQPSGATVGPQGHWCTASVPQAGWTLDGCGNGNPLQVRVLSFNLFWWHLFGRRKGDGGSAGHLIRDAFYQHPFDVMAFQECEDLGWVLSDAGLYHEYSVLAGPHALCLAFRTSTWHLLADDAEDVSEDRGDQWYGTRAGMWMRLQHASTGQVLFFVNHHGPLPVGTGGRCGGEATAYNVLRLIAEHAHVGDVAVLVGDFNAAPGSATVDTLRSRMHQIYTGSAFGGVDHILSSCPNAVTVQNLGDGGSDHDAISATFQL